MRILIATGIYPPDIGGPATYAKNLRDVWTKQGHEVEVVTFGKERVLPPGARHLTYFFKVLFKMIRADRVFVLDTWSAALPTMCACAILGKKYVIRTGGDFLWESYVERTDKPALFRNFYQDEIHNLTHKERLIFRLSRAVLERSGAVIFSTEWQKNIFEKAYSLDSGKNFVVENCYMAAEESGEPKNRNFTAGSRRIRFKNIKRLERAFEKARYGVESLNLPDIHLDTQNYPHEQFIRVMKDSYAVIMVSLGDISPNIIMEALRYGTPCIVTEENGVLNRISNHVLLVDPLDEEDIKNKIVWLSDPAHRQDLATRARAFNFTHSWEEIGKEITDIMNQQS